MKRLAPTYLVRLIAVIAAAWIPAVPASANFHLAVINEVVTSYDGDPDVQFVEILMNAGGQHIVQTSKLVAFDADGNYLGVILTMDRNVLSGAGRCWLMGTAAFQQATGLAPDFVFSPALPQGGGMVCWGKPAGGSEADANCNTAFGNYIDCVAYGNYRGPSNNCTGRPTRFAPDGHSVARVDETNDNFADFVCGDPAIPENNSFGAAVMPATAPCVTVTTSTTTTTSTTSTTTTLPTQICGDANGDQAVSATDALFVLQVAVGLRTCDVSVCDVDDSGTISPSDALVVLRFSTGQGIALNCPAP